MMYCTHNPQDFFNGQAPAELSKTYITDNLELDTSREIHDGYQVIVSEAEKDEE